ncbi:MAG: dermonecrotic toxin domain-containing protein [Pseudomonas sp.]|uniref:dermonecrotic toxin domain-containing protein n=1 Tax=Pseudomonas sp. TaxID=306 RepID=UPI003D6FDE12
MTTQNTATETEAFQPDAHYQHLINVVPPWLRQATTQRREALSNSTPRLPASLKNASPHQHAELGKLIAHHVTSQNRVDQMMANLQSPADFAESLLEAEIKSRYGLTLDVRKTFLRLYIPAHIPWLRLKSGAARTWTVSLLDAALHNFESAETEADAFEPASTYITSPSANGHFDTLPLILKKMPITGFTRLCRELDIGQRYKEYLEDNLGISNPVAAALLKPKVHDSQKTALTAALHMAQMQKLLGSGVHQLILGVMDNLPHLRLHGQPWGCHELTIMSTRLTGIILFSPDLDQTREVVRVVAYIPDDPEHPIKQYPSSAAFAEELLRRLRTTDYQQFFSRFINHEDRGRFFSQLNAELASITWQPVERGDPRPTWREKPNQRANLHIASKPIKGDVWTHLYQSKLDKILNDARVIAVSTATVDRKARWALWDSFTEIASILLNVAAFIALPFVPLLGEVMLAYMAYQLLDDTFESVIDWAEGRSREAFEHLMGAVESAVQLGTFAVGGAIAATELRNVLPKEIVQFVEGFSSVTRPNGEARYWLPDLGSYEHPEVLPEDSKPDHLGLHRHQGKTLLTLEDKRYGVSEDPVTGKHRIDHPTRPEAYKPALKHNGSGAWQTELDRPLHWDKAKVARRMGHNVETFTDLELDQALTISNTHEDVLRKMHVHSDTQPPLLADTLKRMNIEKDIQGLIDQLDSDDPLVNRKADPQTQLQLLTSTGMWPDTKALRLLDAQGNPLLEYSKKDDLPVVQIQAGQLNNGDVLVSALKGLNQNEIKTMFNEGFGSPALDINVRARHLRKKLGHIARENRAALFDSRYSQQETATDPHLRTIKKAAPELPLSIAQELLSRASGDELWEVDNGLLPKRLLDLAHQSNEEVRVARAYEGLYLHSVNSTDTKTLALRSLERLPGWSSDVRIAVHDKAFDGPLVDSIGDAKAPIRKVLVLTREGRYQAFDEQGQQLSTDTDLYGAVLHALPDAQRNSLNIAIGASARLKQAIGDTPLERTELRSALSLPPTPKPVVETLRLLGTDGYTKVRGEAPRTLKDRVRELYPNLPDAEIEVLLQRLQDHPNGPRAELSRRRDEYQQLEQHLHIWANNPPAIHPTTQLALSDQEVMIETRNRRRLRAEILRCWRHETGFTYDALGAEGGRLFTFFEPIIGELPELNGDFSHVSSLTLAGNKNTAGIDTFLSGFPGLRRLVLRDCNVPQLPQAINALSGLEELILSDCGLVLTAQTQATLSSLSELRTLDLYKNPLGITPNVVTLPKLTYIDCTETGISSMPEGVVNHPRLRTALFKGNQISELPVELFNLPIEIAQGYDLENNPLSAASRERIKAYYQQTEMDLGVFADQADIDRTKALYPSLDNEEASNFIYQLPGTLEDGRVELANREQELARLITDLNAWAANVPDVHPVTNTPLTAAEMFAEHVKRDEFKQNLERCWRQIPIENTIMSEYSFTSNLAIMGDLPTLNADFTHVPDLSLRSSGGIAPRLGRFLDNFSNLESLSIRGYQLGNIPEAVFNMGRLTVLSLPECAITLTPTTVDALAGMDRLDHLNLRNNPLGMSPDLSHMTEISSLNLSHTGISEIPRGLFSINTWTDVDLSHNVITEMPIELIEVEAGVGESFDFSENPLTDESLERIAVYYRATDNDLGIPAVANMPRPEGEASDTDIED